MKLTLTQDDISTCALLDEGTYQGTIVSIEEKTSRIGNDMLRWMIRLDNGQSFPFYTVTTPGKRARFVKTLLNLGYSQDQDFDTDELIGRDIVVRIGIEAAQDGDGQINVIRKILS